ncbi:MAG: hypothetical protein IT305_29130 [Chloroflexi bacterium]|nr:hypothetical protein [Chloroflexota bacterium]
MASARHGRKRAGTGRHGLARTGTDWHGLARTGTDCHGQMAGSAAVILPGQQSLAAQGTHVT